MLVRASLEVQMVNKPPAKQETWIPSLGQEDPLEKEIVTHCSLLAWRIPWTEEPGGLQSMGSQKSDVTEHAHIHRAGEDPEHLEFHS